MIFSDSVRKVDVYGRPAKILKYGTAGFRSIAAGMESTLVRCGMLAALRSRHGGASCGIMITASHNQEADNGAKIADTHGGMLQRSWEGFAESLINAEDTDAVLSCINDIIDQCGISTVGKCKVIIGCDTRPSSGSLKECAIQGIKAMGGSIVDLGEVTTPQLHFAVKCANSGEASEPDELKDIYFSTICRGYLELKKTAGARRGHKDEVTIDCANGVGSITAARLEHVVVPDMGSLRNVLTCTLRNEAYSGPVNEECGAELVQKERRPCRGVSKEDDEGKLLCSYDGDADRIVFHSFLGDDWVLYDGDKIAVLFGKLLQQELEAAHMADSYTFCVVQTAYANGASTDCLRAMKVPVVMAKTGVKFLHHVAQAYDIGLYFEANGHGTVLFSDKFLAHLEKGAGEGDGTKEGDRAALAFQRLRALVKLINPAVGDAISDMLGVLACLDILACDWRGLYTDLPSRQQKVAVRDKSVISCSDDECQVVAPEGLQRDLDACMAAVPRGRCFVRPSGTEDIVRIYAEAESEELARQLAASAEEMVLRHC